MTAGFWRDRRVLVTGHTGFKGAWLALWLQRLGARVTGFALPADDPRSTFPSLKPWEDLDSHLGDLRDPSAVAEVIRSSEPEVVFHLAAQALVRHGYANPFETFHTNVVGTANLLHQVGASPGVRAIVVVTSDKVYANDSTGAVFSESGLLGGEDPYSASKALTELLVDGWRRSPARSRGTAISTARAGNVIGGGDRGTDRLLPDAWRALEAGKPLRLRYPHATRPWQFVLEPLYGYILLAERLVDAPESAPPALNFAPSGEGSLPVADVVAYLFEQWGEGSWEPSGDASLPEAPSIHLDSTLARRTLGWAPRLSLPAALDWTTRWWRGDAEGADLRQLALSQISAYEDLATIVASGGGL